MQLVVNLEDSVGVALIKAEWVHAWCQLQQLSVQWMQLIMATEGSIGAGLVVPASTVGRAMDAVHNRFRGFNGCSSDWGWIGGAVGPEVPA